MADKWPKGLALCHKYAEYAQALLHERTRKTVGVRPEPLIPLAIKGELETIVGRLLDGWENKVQLPYSFDEVLNGLKAPCKGSKEEFMRQKFGSSLGGAKLVDRPSVFVDRDGFIVCWYLPSIITARRSEQVVDTLKTVSEYSNSVIRIPSTDSWRDNPESFAEPSKCVVPPGHVNLSICWYIQGRAPSKSLPAPSASLNETPKNQGGPQLLEELTEVNALIGALLSLVHPELFEKQLTVLAELASGRVDVHGRDLMDALFESWSSPFNGLAVVSNRETAYHRDVQGGQTLYDIVATFGSYRGGRFEIPILASRFNYGPGTCLVFPGSVFEHGASKTVGEQFCLAGYIRPKVAKAAFPNDLYVEPALPTLQELAQHHGLALPEIVSSNIWEQDTGL